MKINLQLFAEGEANTDSGAGSEVLTEAQANEFSQAFDEEIGNSSQNEGEEDNEEGGENGEESTEEETSETLENEEVDEDTESDAQKEQTEGKEKKYTIKHNGQTIDLTYDELITHAQKGFDYDRIRQDRDNLKNSRELQLLDTLAKEAGMSRIDFVEHFYKNLEDTKLNDRAVELMSEKGLDQATALEIAKYELENKKLKDSISAKENASKEAQSKQEKIISDFNALFIQYPDLREKYKSYDELPESFRKSVENGESPIEAWKSHLLSLKEQELKDKEKELEILKNNEKNKKRSTGSMKSKGSAKDKDDFVSGLLG